MKKIIYNSLLIAISVVTLYSCKPKFNTPSPNKGSINPTSYGALGGSMTAGYADGALYNEAQINSFPNLIAGQLKLVGGGNFNQPLISPSSVGIGSAGNAPFKLGYSTDCLGVNSLGPIPAATTGDASILATSVYSPQNLFNNMGVPSAKATTIVESGYGNPANGVGKYNPFYTRIASNPATASLLSDVQATNPTFFSALILDDVLTYAMHGAASDSISSSSSFDASILAIINALTASGAKGVIGNIPDITAFPFFTTVPWNGLTLAQSDADQLNAVLPFLGVNYTFIAGNNPFVIYDASVPTPSHARVIKSDELILLTVPLDSIKCHKMGTLTPIPNQYVLTETEISNIKTAISAFNNTVKSTTQAKNLAFVDVASFFSQAKTGINYNGISLNTQFVTGGAFSLDGINLNPVGNALLANEFIKAINTTYGSTIPLVDVTKYRGIVFP